MTPAEIRADARPRSQVLGLSMLAGLVIFVGIPVRGYEIYQAHEAKEEAQKTVAISAAAQLAAQAVKSITVQPDFRLEAPANQREATEVTLNPHFNLRVHDAEPITKTLEVSDNTLTPEPPVFLLSLETFEGISLNEPVTTELQPIYRHARLKDEEFSLRAILDLEGPSGIYPGTYTGSIVSEKTIGLDDSPAFGSYTAILAQQNEATVTFTVNSEARAHITSFVPTSDAQAHISTQIRDNWF